MSFQKILVAIDFSEDSINALNLALKEFARPDRALTLVHVVDTSDVLSPGRIPGMSQSGALTGSAPDPAATALSQLRELASTHAGHWRDIQTLVKNGVPTEAIADTVKTEAIDLLIVGAHGAGGLRRMLFGGTTYDVARKVGCTVVVSRRK